MPPFSLKISYCHHLKTDRIPTPEAFSGSRGILTQEFLGIEAAGKVLDV
jgi:hypothetical protein